MLHSGCEKRNTNLGANMRTLSHLRLRWCVAIMLVGLGVFSSLARAQAAANEYFDLIEDGLAVSRQQLPMMTAAAEQSGERFIAGGQVFVFSNEPEFISEATGRAGGLMCIKRLNNLEAGKNDVILFGLRDGLTATDRSLIKKWRQAGAYVVTFGAGLDKNADPAAQADFTSVKEPGLKITQDNKPAICPVDTVMNAVNLWAFTGELVAACTRRGKMPVLYQSYGMPGGRERGKKYQGKKFHDDMTIESVKPGLFGKAYLDAIGEYVGKIRANETKKIARSADEMKTSRKTQLPLILAMGHMFPATFLDPRSPQGIDAHATTDQAEPNLTGQPGRYVLFVGYQKAPEKLVESAGLKKFPLTYISVEKAKSPDIPGQLLYINPYWPIADSCVSVPGYDVPILPASGVIDAIIYWAIRAEECR